MGPRQAPQELGPSGEGAGQRRDRSDVNVQDHFSGCAQNKIRMEGGRPRQERISNQGGSQGCSLDWPLRLESPLTCQLCTVTGWWDKGWAAQGGLWHPMLQLHCCSNRPRFPAFTLLLGLRHQAGPGGSKMHEELISSCHVFSNHPARTCPSPSLDLKKAAPHPPRCSLETGLLSVPPSAPSPQPVPP